MTNKLRNFDEDQRICAAATEGPWYWDHDVVRCGSADDQVRGMGIAFDTAIPDGRFIAEARTGWSAALDEIRGQAAEIERLRNGLIAIKTRTEGSGVGTTADGVYKIAARTLLAKEAE